MLEWAFIAAVDSSIHQPYMDKGSDRADRLEHCPLVLSNRQSLQQR